MVKQDIFVAIGHFLISVFGAASKWFSNTQQQPRSTLMREMFVASFGGVLVFFIRAWLDFNVYLAFALAGLAGWFGTKGIEALSQFILKKNGMPPLSDDDKK